MIVEKIVKAKFCVIFRDFLEEVVMRGALCQT